MMQIKQIAAIEIRGNQPNQRYLRAIIIKTAAACVCQGYTTKTTDKRADEKQRF
jgi:hypothetical protein